MKNKTGNFYDVVIVGGGHNGLIASCYLAMAGLQVLILEKDGHLGGATYSNPIFPGVDVQVSVYSYLVSLLPQKILTDLGIEFHTHQRSMASFTPVVKDGIARGLLISNTSEDITRDSFYKFTGSGQEYQKYRWPRREIGHICPESLANPRFHPCLLKRNCEINFGPNKKEKYGIIWLKNRYPG